MWATLILCSGLLAGDAPAPASAEETRAAYLEAKAQAGRNADAHVRLAIWCGEHGMDAERIKHLAIALVIDPKNAQARELLDQAEAKLRAAAPTPGPEPAGEPGAGKSAAPPAGFGPPAPFASFGPPAPPADPAALAQYNERREKTPNTVEAQWQLALWCEQKGLKAEAAVHLTNVVKLDPSREAAWRHLGFKKHNGRWMTDQQIAMEKAALEAQKKADRHWKPLLEKWKSWLAMPAKRAEAEKALAGVADPWAVPSIWRVFGAGDPSDQTRAVQLLGQVRAPNASRLLAVLAIAGKTDAVRTAALEVLRQRNPAEFVDLWIALLRKPIKYEVRPAGGPGAPGEVYVEGERFNVRRLYFAPSVADTYNTYAGPWVYHPRMPLSFGSVPMPPPGSVMVGSRPDGTGLYWHDQFLNPPPGAMPKTRSAPDPSLAYQALEAQVIQQLMVLDWLVSETQKMAYGVALRQKSDVDAIEAHNKQVRAINGRAGEALASVTGQNLGEDREAWIKWWSDLRGYAYNPPAEAAKATVLLNVPLPYMPMAGPPLVMPGIGTVGAGGGAGPGWCLIYDHGRDPATGSQWWHRATCFAAGTAVLTPQGPRPIEALASGAEVLGADGATAETVEAVARNSSCSTLRLLVGGETLVTTAGHPFWSPERGWLRAGDLRPGDRLGDRNGGYVAVEAVEPGAEQPVFNLRLAAGHCFLVGRRGLVVHDLSADFGILCPAVATSGRRTSAGR